MVPTMAGSAVGVEMADQTLGQFTRARHAGEHGFPIERARRQLAGQQRLQHLVLAGEMHIEAALGQAGAARDVLHAGVGIAPRREFAQRGAGICSTRKAGGRRRRPVPVTGLAADAAEGSKSGGGSDGGLRRGNGMAARRRGSRGSGRLRAPLETDWPVSNLTRIKVLRGHFVQNGRHGHETACPARRPGQKPRRRRNACRTRGAPPPVRPRYGADFA